MEKAYTKMRMELREEDRTKVEKGEGEKETEKETAEQEERIREEDAKLRQVYDPVGNVYDDRKRRVTDLPECNRVTLPKPLSVHREAQINTGENCTTESTNNTGERTVQRRENKNQT